MSVEKSASEHAARHIEAASQNLEAPKSPGVWSLLAWAALAAIIAASFWQQDG